MNLNHIHLGTKNLAQFIEFYKTYFGFKMKSSHGEGAFLVNDKNFLLAVDPVENLPELPTWYHLGFCLDNADQVFSLYQKMKLANVNIVRDMRAENGEFASFFANDPDGNRIEISWHKE